MENTIISVRLTPRSSRTGIDRFVDGILHARVCAPPVDGAANTALIGLLSETLRVPKTTLSITTGATGRQKRVQVSGLAESEVRARLSRWIPDLDQAQASRKR